MGKYRKKPVVIDAVRWLGGNLEEVCTFIVAVPEGRGTGHVPATGELLIPTLEGVLKASPGDWIIKGVAGEFYPCKPDIFERTYEEVKESVSDDQREME